MKDKRGQGISMEFIIIAAIALIVLIVIVLFFTGGLEKIFGGQKEIIGSVSDQQKEIWRSQCKLYCSVGQRENFINKEFKGADNQIYKCPSTATGTGIALNVECGECKGTATQGTDPCSQRKAQAQCTSPCTWTNWQ
jgi:uncharacterized protein (UPF0333 family)